MGLCLYVRELVCVLVWVCEFVLVGCTFGCVLEVMCLCKCEFVCAFQWVSVFGLICVCIREGEKKRCTSKWMDLQNGLVNCIFGKTK